MVRARAKVRHETRRNRRKVGIVAAEEYLRRDRLGNLHERTVFAKDGFKGDHDLWLTPLSFGQKSIGKWFRPEIEKGYEPARAARPTLRQGFAPPDRVGSRPGIRAPS